MEGNSLALAAEVQRLRDRAHDHANLLTSHTAQIEQLDQRWVENLHTLNEKLDSQHASVKEDLGEIRAQTTATNGRVTEHDRSIAKMSGGLIVLALGMPAVTGLIVFGVQKLAE